MFNKHCLDIRKEFSTISKIALNTFLLLFISYLCKVVFLALMTTRSKYWLTLRCVEDAWSFHMEYSAKISCIMQNKQVYAYHSCANLHSSSINYTDLMKSRGTEVLSECDCVTWAGYVKNHGLRPVRYWQNILPDEAQRSYKALLGPSENIDRVYNYEYLLTINHCVPELTTAFSSFWMFIAWNCWLQRLST